MIRLGIIKNKKEYKLALKRAGFLMEKELNSEEEKELYLLGYFVDRYEDEHYPIGE